MRTELRAIDDSVVLIIPDALVAELGEPIDTEFEIKVEGGVLILSPLASQRAE